MQCSMQPLMPARKTFWRDGSISLFERRKDWKREARIRWNVLPTAEERERAIMRKFTGSDVGPDLCMRMILERDQQGGEMPVARIFE